MVIHQHHWIQCSNETISRVFTNRCNNSCSRLRPTRLCARDDDKRISGFSGMFTYFETTTCNALPDWLSSKYIASNISLDLCQEYNFHTTNIVFVWMRFSRSEYINEKNSGRPKYHLSVNLIISLHGHAYWQFRPKDLKYSPPWAHRIAATKSSLGRPLNFIGPSEKCALAWKKELPRPQTPLTDDPNTIVPIPR